jgi:signal transduction histidine kinase
MEKRISEITGKLARTEYELRSEIEKRKLTEVKFRKARAEAAAAINAKYEFLANMSHELRLPMNHIIGFTQILLSKKFGDLNRKQEEYLQDVLKSGNHLLIMLSDILDLVQVDSGKSKLFLEEIDLRLLLEKCITAFYEQAKKKYITLALDLGRLPKTVLIDRHKFRRIIHNLLSNAIKYTPDGGNVILKASVTDSLIDCSLRTEDSGRPILSDDSTAVNNDAGNGRRQCLECSVTDTGLGVAPEHHDRIFNLFEQLDASSEKYYQGIGLGLALAKRFVEMHGGMIAVKSEGENRGSTFHFVIPTQL